MDKHRLILVVGICLVVVLGILVYCFFEKKERMIDENIQQLESASGMSELTHRPQIQVIDESPEIGMKDISSACFSLPGVLSISKKGILRAKIQKV